MWSWKGFIAVVVTAGVLAVPLYQYWDFLTRGMQPPPSTKRLDQLEKDGVPNFKLNDLQGQPVELYSFKGRIVLVNLWATWCAPCVKEIPSLKGLVEKMKGDLVVLAVSHDKNKEDVETFLKAFGGLPKDFIVVWDEKKITGPLFGTDVLPETYILNRELKLLRKVSGETVWDDALALQFFKDIAEGRMRE